MPDRDDDSPEDQEPWNTRQKRAPPEIDAILSQGRERLGGLPPVKSIGVVGAFTFFAVIACSS
ncbi:HflK protein, partial [Thioclava sp. BHET1]